MSPYAHNLLRKGRDAKQFSVLMGMDALRMCLGREPRNFTVKEIIRWLRLADRRAALTLQDTGK